MKGLILSVLGVFTIVLAVSVAPDIRRYLKMRAM